MVDKKQLAMTGAAAAALVLLPVVVEAVQGLRSGRWDSYLARLQPKPPARPRAAARPIEQLAADFRRLRGAVASDSHRSAERQLADLMAYDRVLVELCDMLAITHHLGPGVIGRERDLERFRLEAEVERAGITLTDPSSRR